MHYRSVGHGYHAIPISHPTSSNNAPRHAGPSGAGPTLGLASREARDDKSSPRSRTEGRAGDSLTGPVKIRKLPSAHLQSITGFPRSGCASSSRIICLSRDRAKDFSLSLGLTRLSAPRVSGGGTRNASRENKTSGGRGGGDGCG